MNQFARPGLGATELPPVSADDNGKVLGVSDGAWAKVAASGGSDLPDDPAQDGTYNLQNTVSSGTGTLSWASGSSGGGVLVVKFTSGRDGWTCDKTYAEIVSAITSGTPVMCLTENSETGNVKYDDYNQAVNALFFDVEESTLYVITLTIDSSNSIDESVHSITLT